MHSLPGVLERDEVTLLLHPHPLKQNQLMLLRFHIIYSSFLPPSISNDFNGYTVIIPEHSPLISILP